MLSLFNHLANGRELASDVVFHAMIIADPLATLMGTATTIASYPPFQWVVEWPLFSLYSSFASDFISFRLLMVTVEFACLLQLINVLRFREVESLLATCVVTMFIFSPHQLFATIFFVQEDIIAQCFMLSALLFIFRDRRTAAIIILTVGILVAKLFLIIPLFFVVAYLGRVAFTQRLIEGVMSCAVLVSVYVLIIYNAFQNGGDIPLLEFTPDGVYASNYWVLLLAQYPESLEAIKGLSLKLSLAVQLIVIGLGLYLLIRAKNHHVDSVIWMSVPLAMFFATFYQHMPEYLLLIWPVLIFMYRSISAQILIVACLNLAWLPRIFHGLGTVGQTNMTSADARADLIAPVLQYINIDPQLFNVGFILLHSVAYTLLVFSLISLAFKSYKHNSQQAAKVSFEGT